MFKQTIFKLVVMKGMINGSEKSWIRVYSLSLARCITTEKSHDSTTTVSLYVALKYFQDLRVLIYYNPAMIRIIKNSQQLL